MHELYHVWDRSLIDYQVYRFGTVELRGPAPEEADYVCFLGAAQTFGRFCPEPFPMLAARSVRLAAMNCGIGGAGPGFFLRHEELLSAANRAKMVVIQVMSGRSVSNSIFISTEGGRDGFRLCDQKHMPAEEVFDELLTGKDRRGLDAEFLTNLVEETKRNYETEMIRLLRSIRPPKILFWFSVRSADALHPRVGVSLYSALYNIKRGCARLKLIPRREELYGCFPHLVDAAMLSRIRSAADSYAECVTHSGLPQMILSPTGALRWNTYYPSPQMHRQAAAQLLPALSAHLQK